jgi:type IV pilus assembly protein PilV
MNLPAASTFRKSQQGFTLLEVLVAVLVLSIGLLGMSALTMNVLRANDSSYFQSQAAILANAILDDMRANATEEIKNGSYNINFGTYPAKPSTSCDVGTCTSAQMAAYDLWAWTSRVAAEMPVDASSGGKISFNTTTNQATVSVQWIDNRAQGVFGSLINGGYNSLTLSANLP